MRKPVVFMIAGLLASLTASSSLAASSVAPDAASTTAIPPARLEKFLRHIDLEMEKNPLFHELEILADRHGFQIYVEKDSADSLLRVIGTDALQTAHVIPNLDFLGALENISLVIRGSQYQLDLVRSLITRYLDRTNLQTGKSRWETRLETREEKDFVRGYGRLIPKVFIACHGCADRVDPRLIEFFVANEAEERATQSSLELLLKLRELQRAITVRPIRIQPELFHSSLVMISRMNPFQLKESELPEIFEVMTAIDNMARTPNVDNGLLQTELKTLGFEKAYREVSKRVLDRPEFKYAIDFSAVPESVVKRAAAVTDYVQWASTIRSCEAVFESVGQAI